MGPFSNSGGLSFPQAGGLVTKITWKAGKPEVICLHGDSCLCCLAGNSKGTDSDLKRMKSLRFT